MRTKEQMIFEAQKLIIETLAREYVRNLVRISDRLQYCGDLEYDMPAYVYSDKSMRQACDQTRVSRSDIAGKMYRIDVGGNISDEAIDKLESENVIRKVQSAGNADIMLVRPMDPISLSDENPFRQYIHNVVRIEKILIPNETPSLPNFYEQPSDY